MNMNYLVKFLLIFLGFQFNISTCFSQINQDFSLETLKEPLLTLNYKKSPLDYLLATEQVENKKIYSDIYPSRYKMETNSKYFRRSRLCVISTIALVSVYLYTKDKNENLALGSVVAALATSSLGLVYYIKAKKKY